MSELHDLTALEQAAAIRRRELSPVELTEHYLDAHRRGWNADVGAFITLTPDVALDQARAAERGRAGRPTTQGRSRCCTGPSVPVKDLYFEAGVRCTLGSLAYDMTPYGDDHVVHARCGRAAWS